MEDIKLTFLTSDQIEQNRTDFDRFSLHVDYMTEDSLKHFREPILKELFVKVFWEKPDNLIWVFDDAVERSGHSPRVQQVRDLVIAILTRERKLTPSNRE